MKRMLLVVCLSILVIFVITPVCAEYPNEVVIKYSEFKNHPVELVLDKNNGRVILRIRFDDGEFPFDHYKWSEGSLDFLKSEVERFVATNQPVMMGNTGIYFKFSGAYPIWGPYSSWSRNVVYECLYFANSGSIIKSTLYAVGVSNTGYYYPYKIPANRHN